jgi:hypothetical protein
VSASTFVTDAVVIGAVFGDDARMKIRLKAKVLLLCTVALLGACHKDSGSGDAANSAPQAKIKAPVVAKSGPTAAEQTAGMVEAAVQGKSALPAELKFDLPQRPKVGQTQQVDLALIAQVPGNPATIQVSGADGLSVDPAASQLDIPATEAGEVYRHTVNITPTAEGVLLLGVKVSLKHDEVTDAKSFSIPIIAER